MGPLGNWHVARVSKAAKNAATTGGLMNKALSALCRQGFLVYENGPCSASIRYLMGGVPG